ncbi:MAG: tetratricopeptide repeat protein [Verrucomicrobiota bacterium]
MLLLLPRASACLWDGDTIAMENARFPKVIEIITGNFPRHSREFHQWRVAETRKQLETDPKAMPLYDDLAVSQHKLGDHPAAFATMKSKENLQPGIYETYSNMGTFLIYTGELPKALDFINKALSINPHAHFGREKYQKWLVQWVIAGKPVMSERPGPDEKHDFRSSGYSAFVLSKTPRKIMTAPLREEAIKGVLGMMRFADFDNPILQEALGDLLCTGKSEENATHLASLAYLHASQKATAPEEQTRLAKKFDTARSTFPEGGKAEDLALELKEGLAKGEKLAASVRNDEITWIQQGKDVSAEFTGKYLVPEKGN